MSRFREGVDFPREVERIAILGNGLYFHFLLCLQPFWEELYLLRKISCEKGPQDQQESTSPLGFVHSDRFSSSKRPDLDYFFGRTDFFIDQDAAGLV